MAFIPRPKAAPGGFHLTPMIDVTFQLLIFFVCANTWGHVQSAERLSLPAPIRSGRESAEDGKPRVTINVRAAGEVLVMGRVVMGKNESRERLSFLLKGEQQKNANRLEVLIRVDRDVPYARTQEVFQACAAAGISRVRFAVLREK
jgi:biopolymer transport protein ExbD